METITLRSLTKIKKHCRGQAKLKDLRAVCDEQIQRIEAYKEELNQTDSMHECERIQERITKLASGIAIIRVCAATEIEMIEKKHHPPLLFLV